MVHASLQDTFRDTNHLEEYGLIRAVNVTKQFEDIPLLFGCHYYERVEKKKGDTLISREKVHNSLLLYDEGKRLDVYKKVNLVPFSEEIPIRAFNVIMNWYGLNAFTRGDGPKIMKIGNIKLTPNICYEAIFPGFIRKSINACYERGTR